MLNRIFVVDSVTLSSTGTAVSSYVPWDQTTRKLPTQVVVKATGQGAYVRLSNDNSAATNVDVLVQGGDHVVLSVQGRRWVSVLSDGASSTVSVGALSTGVSGDAASLSLDFAGTGTLDPQVTFTRASTATFFNSAGVLTSAATNAPRFDYNPSTLAAQGLLIEESRTNLLLQSQDFATTWAASGTSPAVVTANTTTSLDGTVNADTVSGTGANSDRVQQTVTVAASTTYVISFFVKNSTSVQSRFHVSNPNSGTTNSETYITWSGSAITGFINTGTTVGVAVAYPNNWWRVYFAFTTNASDAGTATVRFYPNSTGADATFKAVFLWGAQIEAGAFPTSYIPTTTTALTRAADVASVNTLSPWYNAVEGTLFAEGAYIGLIVARQLAALTDGTTSNLISVQTNPSTATVARGSVIVSGSGQASLNGPAGSITAGVTTKMAIAYKTDDFAFSVGGSTPATDTSGTLPVVDRLQIGAASTAYSTAYLRRITYYPRRLSNAELVSITS